MGKIIATAGLILGLLAVSGYAQDMPVTIPANLPSEVSGQLNVQRQELLRKLEMLKAEVETHNQKCSHVPEGSALDADCLQKLRALQSEVSIYSSNVHDFNKRVMQAIAASSPRVDIRNVQVQEGADPNIREALLDGFSLKIKKRTEQPNKMVDEIHKSLKTKEPPKPIHLNRPTAQ